MKYRNLLWMVLASFIGAGAFAQSSLSSFPDAASPKIIGERLTHRFLSLPHATDPYDKTPHIPYYEVCAWYGALTFAGAAKERPLLTALNNRFLPLFKEETALLPVPDHVDYTMFGALPLELYLQNGESKYKILGLQYADTQWKAPAGPRVIPASFDWYKKGYTWQTRLWIDDMFMITIVQAQAYRATGDTTYINRAAREMILYLDSLQKPNGLFYHAPASPFYWGRGNGWMAAGMTELLRSLPAISRYRPRILKSYRLMMTSLLRYQSPNGMWRQLIDDNNSWEETSSTGMFAFAFITGVKMGWLPAKDFAMPARQAWLALVNHINEQGDITDICEGTGAGSSRQYYYDRKRLVGDLHGQAPVLWCATALLRK